MRHIKKWLVYLQIAALFLSIAGCAAPSEPNSSSVLTTFRDIPGVTEDEIKAIESLREQYESFVYVMPPSTEAFVDVNGNIGGFSLLFCEWLTELFGVPFIPENRLFGDVLAGLQSGEVDFTGTMTPTEERKAIYHMTDPIAIRTLKYFRLRGSLPLSEIQATRPARFALLQGSSVAAKVISSLDPNTFEAVFIENNIVVYEMLKSGEIDAFIHESPTESVFDNYNDVITQDFLPAVMSQVSLTTQKPELEPVISIVQKFLQNDGMRYLIELYNLGEIEYRRHKLYLHLTEDELNYIRSNPVVGFVAEHDNYPVSFYNAHDKEFQGASHDLLSEIGMLTGLRFELLNDQHTDWSDIFLMLENGEASMVTELIRSPERTGRFLWSETKNLTDYHALLSKAEFQDIGISEILYMTVGLVRGYAHTEIFELWFPEHRYTVVYDNYDQAFAALERGEVDMVMGSQAKLLTQTNFREQPGYKANIVFDYPYESVFGFNKNEVLLCSIIENALQVIDTNSIADKWMSRTYDYRVKLTQAYSLWLISGAVLLLCAVILFFLLKAKNRAEKASKQKSMFLATMSHEIRTPMNAILGAAQIQMQKDGIPEEYAEGYRQIYNSGSNLLGAISDILNQSKIEAEKSTSAGADERKKTRENKSYSIKKFIIFSTVLFLFVLTVGSVVFIFSMQNIVRNNKSIELTQMLEMQKIKMENSINSEIAIVLTLAESPLIKRYFSNPFDAEIEKLAREEISGYRRAFSSFSIFWINDIDMIFYSDDNTPYVVDPEDPESYWYNLTLYETEVYNFNINYNPDIHMAKLWINAPVFNGDNQPIGMVGTGIELTAYVDMLYQGMDEDVALYLFNDVGEITGSKDVESVVAKRTVSDEMHNIGFNILAEAKKLGEGEHQIYTAPADNIVISTIPLLHWYSIAISPVGINDFDPVMIALFLAMLSVLAVTLVIFNVFTAGILKSLKKTMDSLEDVSKAKSEFLAIMSHEIRTPMNAIIGISQIQLQKGNLPDEYETALGKIYNSGNSLLGIINDILDMSKIEMGKMELSPVKYDVPSLINDAVQLNIVRIGSKPVDFKLDINENLPSWAFGDELRLKQILNNILSNAIKYTDRGFVKLSVNYCAEGDDIILRFTVEDTGQGMKPEDMSRMFSEFERFNAEDNRATEGTGLGLSITKRLVEMMDGTIEAEGEYGKGSIFTVTVRQKAVKCAPIGAELSEKLRNFTFTEDNRHSKTQITREPMPYGKVLVVDDMEINLYVAKGLLSLYGLEIETAQSGYEVIDLISGGKIYDVVFMDHMMPEMDGIETTQKLRALGYTGAIVALTANALVGNEEMFAKNGFDGFVAKPINAGHLNMVLNTHIRDRYPEEAKKYKTEATAQTESFAIDSKLIQIFCRDAEKAAAVLRETITNGDIKLFTTTVHAMKSALANIEENEISKAAFALEEAGIKGDVAFISENTEVFIESLEALVKRITPSKTTDNAKTEADEDIACLIEQLRVIELACDDCDDTAVYAALDRLKEKAWRKETIDALERIHDTLFLHSDFEEAADQAVALSENLNF